MAKVEALSGFKVLECGASIAVQACGRMFAAAGAAVVREAALGAPSEPGAAAFAAWLGQYKRIGAPPAGLDLVIAGPDAADIAHGKARAEAAGAVLLELTWFGEGPYAGLEANDALLQAMTGIAYGFGAADGPPVIPQGHAPQIVTGLVGFIGAMAALLMPKAARPKRIDANVLEAALCFSEPGAVGVSSLGGPARRLGINRFSPTYPCSIYPASDAWVGLTALTPAQWRALLGLIDRPDLLGDRRFATTLGRLGLADEIDALLMPIFAQKSVSYWVEEGIARRIPITPVLRPGELPSAAHWEGRESFSPLTEESSVHGPNMPFAMHFDGVAGKKAGSRRKKAPLAGLRVVDLSMGWAGPLATRMLADLGADIVKIESFTRPDWWRSWEGAPDGADIARLERARNFLDVNRGKRGAAIDLATPEGMAAVRRLVEGADVVIENQGPGAMAKLGLGPEDLHRLKPGIINVQMCAFGATGPLSGIRAYGSTVEQASGMPFVNGQEEWAPCLQHVAYGDPVAGLFAAAAILMALAARPRLGGAAIDLGQVECLFQLGADAILAEQARGAASVRAGSRREACAPCCIVRAAGEGEWLAVTIDSPNRWQALCTVLRRKDWAVDRDLLTCAQRHARADEIEAAIADWARERSADEAAALLQRAGAPAARVLHVQHLHVDPHLRAADFWIEMDRAYTGPHLTGATPFKFDGVRPIRMSPAPTLGQHTDEILAELGVPAR